jgi:hypothetical protein
MYTRRLQFQNLMGFKLTVIDICKKNLFTFSKIFENVPFFEHMHSKFAKNANRKVARYGEFFADSNFV